MSHKLMLVTPTLLNSFRWYTHLYGPEAEDETIGREDFLRMLRREPMQEHLISEAIMKGRRLEEAVVEYCKAPYVGVPHDIEKLAKWCLQGVPAGPRHAWQQSVKTVLDGKYLLYGRTDHIFMDCIDDIKFCGWYDLGKFVRSAQHRIYLHCEDKRNDIPAARKIRRLRYLIADSKDGYAEEYLWHAGIEDEIRQMVNDFMGHLDGDPEAKELFNTHWRSHD